MLKDVPRAVRLKKRNMKIYNYFTGKWEDISFKRGRANNLAGGHGRFGCELSFSEEFFEAYPSETVYLLKCGFGGKHLAQDNLSNSFHPRGGHVFAHFTTVVDTAFDKLYRLSSTVEPELQAILWMQGESDCLRPIRYTQYKRNLSLFIQALRQHLLVKGWGGENVPFIIGELGSPRKKSLQEGAAVIRSSQRELAEELDHVYTVRTENFPLVPGGVHLDEVGLQMLGRAFFEATVSLVAGRHAPARVRPRLRRAAAPPGRPAKLRT
jgi:hypothetical protein